MIILFNPPICTVSCGGGAPLLKSDGSKPKYDPSRRPSFAFMVKRENGRYTAAVAGLVNPPTVTVRMSPALTTAFDVVKTTRLVPCPVVVAMAPFATLAAVLLEILCAETVVVAFCKLNSDGKLMPIFPPRGICVVVLITKVYEAAALVSYEVAVTLELLSDTNAPPARTREIVAVSAPEALQTLR